MHERLQYDTEMERSKNKSNLRLLRILISTLNYDGENQIKQQKQENYPLVFVALFE